MTWLFSYVAAVTIAYMGGVIYLAVLNAVCVLVKNYCLLLGYFLPFFLFLILFFACTPQLCYHHHMVFPCTWFSSSLMIFLFCICLTITWLPCLLGQVGKPSGLPLFPAFLSVFCLMVAVSKVQTQQCHFHLWWLLLILVYWQRSVS